MKRLVKWAAAALALGIVVVMVGVVYVWATVSVNAPWRSMLQQAPLLPAWLDASPITADQVDRQLVTADGYGVSLFASGVSDARVFRVTSHGDVLVFTPRDGRIVLLESDRDDDGVADGQRVLLDGLTRPNGLEIESGYLYIGEEDGVGRIPFNSTSGTVAGVYERIIDDLPSGGNHWQKTIRFGPNGLLYITIGSSCNVCIEEDQRRAAMLHYTPDGEFLDVYATGLRNSAGFDWSPATGMLCATDNGRDMLGDDFPPCELNAIIHGGFYGWPFVNGDNVFDPDFGMDPARTLAEPRAPSHRPRAHTAPLGMTFLRHDAHPPGYRDAAVVALHGSWNRTDKDGYEVVSLHCGADGSVEERAFLTEILIDDVAAGRPTDVAEGPDGSLYVSDDLASAVYRIRCGDSGVTSAVPPKDRGNGYDSSQVDSRERDAALLAGSGVFETAECGSCHSMSTAEGPAPVTLRDLRSTLNAGGVDRLPGHASSADAAL